MAPLVSVRQSASPAGALLATFADGHTYAYHDGLCAWARVADHSYPRSEFTTRLRLPAGAVRRCRLNTSA